MGQDVVVPFSSVSADDPALLEQLAREIGRALAESESETLAARLRTLLQRAAHAVGADDGCVQSARDDGEQVEVATSERITRLVARLAHSAWFTRQLAQGVRTVLPRGAADLPLEAAAEREALRAAGVQALIVLPIRLEARAAGLLVVSAQRPLLRWATAALDQLESLANAFVRATSWTGAGDPPPPPLRDHAEGERRPRRTPFGGTSGQGTIVGDSAAVRYVLYRVEQVAPTNATVLLLGETGTGKELIARAIHERSPRRQHNLVVVNCGALPPTLIESELFGRERGAFTGAHTSQAGRFELANGGTLFLDEIGELPLELQPKLLRVLQEGKVERLGGTRVTSVDVRVIAATNRNLAEDVRRGTFRRDLFYRLNVFPISLPALRERREDIPALVRHLVERLGRQIGRTIQRVPPEALRVLERHDWPGNVRELENVLQQAIILSPDGTLELNTIGAPPTTAGRTEVVETHEDSNALADVEREHIRRVLDSTSWRIEGVAGAAQVLGLRPSTLRSRMRKLGIHRAVPPTRQAV